MSELVAVTTYTGRIQHWADASSLTSGRGQYGKGRIGAALCDASIKTSVYDQEAFDTDRLKWNPAFVSKPITDLPLCKMCAKRAGAA